MRGQSILPLLALVALGLWLQAALWLLPFADWRLSGDLSLAQIRFGFGMLPRLVVALLAGALLGLSGALMQAVLRNPLADPTTLGTVSGAQLAIVLATIFAPSLLTGGNLPVALAGGAAATLLVLALGAARDFAPVTLTIAGMLVGMLAAAIATTMTLGQGYYLLSLMIWNGGALVQDGWGPATRLGFGLAAGLAMALLLARPLIVLSLGAEAARGLGLSLAPLRLGALLLAVALAALVSAELGMIGFIGLAAPAFARALGARSMTARLMLAPLAGAILLSLADGVVLLAAGLGAPALPTGALTGLLGGPLLLWLLPRLRTSVPQAAEHSGPTSRRTRHPARVLALLLAGLFVLALCGLFLSRGPGGWGLIAPELRADFLPLRASALLAAAASGALLAGSGAVLQRLSANPMAAPEVLGVTGGAALGYALTLFLTEGPGPLTLGLGTALGAALSLACLSAWALRSDMAPARILLAGLAIGAFSSAVLSAIMASDDRRAWAILGWLAGSTSHVPPAAAYALAGLALAFLALLLASARWLEILPLGSAVARGLGLPLIPLRLALILATGLATGAATILIGPVSFVGLMAPHLARSLGLTRALPFVLGAWLSGAALMLLAAIAARSLTLPYDLPPGLCATLIGAPWLFLTLFRSAAR